MIKIHQSFTVDINNKINSMTDISANKTENAINFNIPI